MATLVPSFKTERSQPRTAMGTPASTADDRKPWPWRSHAGAPGQSVALIRCVQSRPVPGASGTLPARYTDRILSPRVAAVAWEGL